MNINFPLVSIQTKNQKIIAEYRSSHVPTKGDWLWLGDTTYSYMVTGIVKHININPSSEGLFKIIVLVK